MQGDLTTLERAKAWLAPDQGNLTSQNDDMIARLVTAVSRLALNFTGRDTLARTTRTETYAGGRTRTLLLRHWPVLSVSSLGIAPTTATVPVADYTLEAVRPGGGTQRVYLGGSRTFQASGPAGVSITYETGFVAEERLTTTSGSEPTVTTSQVWLGDEGVLLADGTTPVVGYTVADGVYTLPPAQADQEVVVRYTCVPADIEQAVIGEVGILFRSRQRIGEASKALAQGAGTQSYLPVELSAMARQLLQPYCRVAPQ